MGILWSSPYRLQIFVICLGLVLLTAAFVVLLLSIGLADLYWRLVGGVCASAGSALLVLGICWCVWVVRKGRFAHIHNTLTVGVAPDGEAQTLTSDANWNEEVGIDGPCPESVNDNNDFGLEDDYGEESDDDEDDEEDDTDNNRPDSNEEEEDSFGGDVCIDKRYRLQDRAKTVKNHVVIEDDPSSMETKEEESRLIPV